MLILKYTSPWNGVSSIYGLYDEQPSYPPGTVDEEVLTHNTNSNIYTVKEETGDNTRFYNSAIWKDTANNYAYVILISENQSKYWEYLDQHGYYSTSGPSNRVFYNPPRTLTVSVSDNFATFESDLPVFTDYDEFYDYVTHTYSEWENVIGTIEGLNGVTTGLTNPSKFPAQTPIGETATVDYTEFDVTNAEVTAGIELGEIMLSLGIRTELNDGTAWCNHSPNNSYGLSYNQPPNSGDLVRDSVNDDWFDWNSIYIVCGIDDENHLGRVGLLVKYRTDAPQSGFNTWKITWSSVSTVAYNWILHNVIPLDYNRGGGAGSGYIGDADLFNKKMVGFNVMTSDDPDTKTESVEEAYELPIAGKPKIGNGFCRIKFLRIIAPPDEYKSYVDIINGSGFDTIRNLSNYPIEYEGHSGYAYKKEPSEVTWYAYDTNGITGDWNSTTLNGKGLKVDNTTDDIGIQTLNIVKNQQNSYTVTIHCINATDVSGNNEYYFNYAWWSNHFCWKSYSTFENGIIDPTTYPSGTAWLNKTFTHTNLIDLFNDLTHYVRNINIYVDGEPWSIVDFS